MTGVFHILWDTISSLRSIY